MALLFESMIGILATSGEKHRVLSFSCSLQPTWTICCYFCRTTLTVHWTRDSRYKPRYLPLATERLRPGGTNDFWLHSFHATLRVNVWISHLMQHIVLWFCHTNNNRDTVSECNLSQSSCTRRMSQSQYEPNQKQEEQFKVRVSRWWPPSLDYFFTRADFQSIGSSRCCHYPWTQNISVIRRRSLWMCRRTSTMLLFCCCDSSQGRGRWGPACSASVVTVFVSLRNDLRLV